MKIYGFKTENAQKAYDSVRFNIALQLFEANCWTYGGSKTISERDIRDCVRSLLKSSEDYVETHGLPTEEDTYRFSSGRWTITINEFGDYEILLDFSDYINYFDDEDEDDEEIDLYDD